MNKSIIIGLVCFMVGAASAVVYNSSQNKSYKSGMENIHQTMSPNSDSSTEKHNMSTMTGNMENSMDSMLSGLKNKTGDEFDKAFILEMITHHQGAVKMAEAALQNAKHQEIKELAKAIISAQNKEIQDLELWQEQWYKIK